MRSVVFLFAALMAGASASPFSNTTSATCSGGKAQATGAGPVSSPDTVAAFSSNKMYSNAALTATTPTGYKQMFRNMNGSTSQYAYLGYTSLSTYDTTSCAAKCNAISGCHSFNIFYERDPVVEPGTGSNCDNPSSTVMIKCVFWGLPVDASSATNLGQYRGKFQVVIAGSNGYTNYTQPTPKGYGSPKFLNSNAITAPLNCNKKNTYIGVRSFKSGPFDISLCAQACTATSLYDTQHPPTDPNLPVLCKFFNTYMIYKNGQPVSQECAMYSETWAGTNATNNGQYDGQGNHYTIEYSYASSNASDAGVCSVSSASTSFATSTLSSTTSSSTSSHITTSTISSSSTSTISTSSSTTSSTQTPQTHTTCTTPGSMCETNSSCYCDASETGINFCNDAEGFCADYATCATTSDCSSGYFCDISTECPTSVCISANDAVCRNSVSARFLFAKVRSGSGGAVERRGQRLRGNSGS